MDRWYMKPKRFVGEIAFGDKRVRVNFSVAISKNGVAKVVLDRMPWDMSTTFIADAVFDQQTAQRFFDFVLTGQSRDGSTFQSATVNIGSLGNFFSDTASATIKPASWCLECKIVLSGVPRAKPSVKALLRGFNSIRSASATCRLGEMELRGPMTLKASEKKLLTGALVIEGREQGDNFEQWRAEVEGLFKHVRSVMSFARGERLAAPVVETVWDGRTELAVRLMASQDGRGSGAFTPFDYAPIFRQAVASHFFEPGRAKNIAVAIEWFTMPSGYREAKLTSTMTVLENLLSTNLSPSDLALRPKRQFEPLRDEILVAARRKLEELGVAKEEIEEDVTILRPKLNDLNRRTLKEKIHILAKRWGVPLTGISDEALGKAKQARDHIVHQGQYIPKDPTEDLMNHVRLTQELVVRFVLAALEFEGEYRSPMTGEHRQLFKVLPPVV